MESLYAHFYKSPYDGVSTKEEAEETAKLIKQKLNKVFALDKIPFKYESPIVKEELKSEKRNGYIQQTLRVGICENLDMLVYILTPDKLRGKTSGVVAVCGHGYGCRQIIRQGKNGAYRVINFLDNYQKNFALELVKRGNVVAVFEPLGFGEAKLKKDEHKPFYSRSCEALSMHLLTYGLTTASLRIYQAMCCVSLLRKLPAVDKDSIGIMGISGGGLVSLYTAVLDDRILRCCVSGYTGSFKTSVMARWHCQDNYFPNVLDAGEIYDIACCLAPRSLLIESGNRDPLFPKAGTDKAVEQLTRIYALYGAPDRFYADRFDGKHQISGAKSFDFFNGDRK
jgi:hypothetical protein